MLLLSIVVFPHVLWFSGGRSLVMEGIDEGVTVSGRLSPGLWLCFALIVTHLGLALLATLTSGWPRHPRERAPEIDRNPVEPFARVFIIIFAVAPALMAIAIAFATGRLGPLERIAPLVVLSGLAVVVVAGDKVLLYRERLVSTAWFGLLVAPPLLVALALAIFPWTLGVDLRISQPANAEGRFFADIYQRRTGKPLSYLSGDPRVASAGCAGRAEPSARLFRLGPAPQSVGERRRYPDAGRHAGMAGGRQQRHAPRNPQGAISRHGAGSAAFIPARRAGHIAAHPAGMVDAAADNALVVALAFAHLAAEQPVDEPDIAEDDGQEQERAEQHEDLARRHGRSVPNGEGRWYQVRKI